MKKILALILVLSLVIPSFALFLNIGIFADDAEIITETTADYTDSIGYGGYIVRAKSDGSIMMSPFFSQLRKEIDSGASIEDYMVELTFSLLDGKNGKKIHTHDTVSSTINLSNGAYFDIYLNGSLGNTGYCPTAGKFYDIDISIYTGYGTNSQKKVLYGTYISAEIPTNITTSKYYKPTATPAEPLDCNVSLSYSFNNSLAGSAAGKITVTTDAAGDFLLSWGDDNGNPLTVTVGEKTLKYSSLSSFSITSTKGGTHVQTIPGFTAIPSGAKTIVVTDSNKNLLKSVTLPTDKLLKEKQPNYSFGMVSDIHFNYFFDSTKTIDYAEAAFDTALDFYKKAGVKLITAVGDYSLYGEEESYKEYHDAVAKSGLLVLACGGNHELYANLDVMFGKNGYWRTYMNNGIYDGTVKGVLDIADNGIDFTYQIPGIDDAVFVSLSQWYWDGHTPAQEKLVEPEQLAWLEEQFETHKDKTVYFLFHTYLSDDDYENVDGQGDITSKGGYSYGGHYNEYTEDEKNFRNLLTKYNNVIWFNGHSHYEYSMQLHNENVNIFNYQGTTATMVHVPSLTNPRTVAVNGTSYSSLAGQASQGGLQFVYDDYQIMNGVDIWNEEILSYACYIIYTDTDDIIDEGKVSESEITWTYDAQLNSLRILGEGDLDGIISQNAPWAKYAKNIKQLYVGNGITSIGKDLFNNLINLEEAELKENVSKIGENAFANTSLSTLILPANLKSIEKGAFGGIESIATITFMGTAEKWNSLSIGENNSCLGGKINFKSVKISFVWDDVTWVEDVNVGEVPSFNIIPTKEHQDENKHYLFTGWSNGSKVYASADKLPEATKNTTYTAVFGKEVDRYVTGRIASGLINWSLDRSTSTLTIKGLGIMPDFADSKSQPWAEYSSEISKVVVKKGITAIGKNAFSKLTALTCVVLEEGVTNIKMDALAYNENLVDVSLPSTLKTIGQGTVFNTNNINTIHYGGSAEQWQKLCDGITTMYNEVLTKCKNVIFNGEVVECQHVESNIIGYTKSTHWSRCKICEENFNTEEHSMGEWVIIKPATADEEGIKERTCKCEYKEVGVATLEDNKTDIPETTPDSTATNPQNSSDNSTGIIIAVICSAVVVIAIACVAVILVVRKKKSSTKTK